jgi:two-component system OmpR family sensor kinase
VGTSIKVSVGSNQTGAFVSVADNGPGLSKEDQVRIFERFYRVDPSRKRSSQDGSGLGLSIVDAVMQAHGGTVSVTSDIGKGAVFALQFNN